MLCLVIDGCGVEAVDVAGWGVVLLEDAILAFLPLRAGLVAVWNPWV